jgi:predicted peptidase
MRVAVLLGMMFLCCTVRAAEDKIDEQLVNRFEARVYHESRSSIPYRLFKPSKYDPQQKYPLIFFLHGAVGVGKDNRRQFNGGNEVPAKAITDAEIQAQHPCFFLAPQCPPESGWTSLFDNRPSESMRLSLAAVSKVQQEFSIDRDRLYVVGLSMGGHGVWSLVLRQPKTFAAAVPICSSGNPANAALLIHLPIWCFHGDADPLVPVQSARDMIAAIKKAGGDPKYTEYPGVGHNSYVNAFKEPDLLPWLFSQKRASAGTLTPK